MHCLFLTPPLDGPATGGTLYNRHLLAALAQLPAASTAPLTFEQHSLPNVPARAEQVWVDSLYLAELPELRQRFPGARVGLLLHYLPSLLDNPELRTAGALSATERRALEHADMIITPSEYLRQLVLGMYPGKPCACINPGVEVPQVGGASEREDIALMICNVTENKGVLPFLQALAEHVSAVATFALEIAGSLQLEAAYAERCQAHCQNNAWLREHVSFLGSVPQPELFDRLARASLLVSASRTESYGMALAEARALGTPILARPGGNIANLVAAESGGELLRTDHELAEALCRVLADQRERQARLRRARAAATVRAWSTAALELAALCTSRNEPDV